MKKILYSTAIKLIAVIMFIAVTALAVGELVRVGVSYSISGYYSGGSFEDSFSTYNSLYNGYGMLSAKILSDGKVGLNDSFFSDEGIEYYAENKVTKQVYTNSENEERANREYYSGAGNGAYFLLEISGGEVELSGNKRVCEIVSYDFNVPEGWTPHNLEYAEQLEESGDNKDLDDSVIYMKYTEDTMDSMMGEYIGAVNDIHNGLKTIPVYICAAILLALFLSLVSGRKYGSDSVHMMAIDNVAVDITALIFCAAVLGFGLLGIIITDIYDAFLGSYYNYALLIGGCFAALFIALYLSVVRNIKNHSFLSSWYLGRVIRLLFVKLKNAVKRVFRWIASLVKGFKKLAAANTTYVKILAVSVVSLGVFGIAAIFLGVFLYESDAFASLFMLIVCALIALAILAAIFKVLKGYDSIKDGLKRIKDGDIGYKIELSGSAITDAIAEDINTIGEGLEKAVEESVRSERMKAELITNVSHDLKTPLTSIINYTDLLMQQKLKPDEANDYVKIIDQKSKRLKQLTADLFDVSKARSGNEELEIEKIDYKLLITQTIAELEKEIKNSGLEFVVDLPDGKAELETDGKKLSRVYENLIINALKYSLKGTRVYIDMKLENGSYITEIKNIAGYKMDFSDNDITERFVRGDSSRTGDGSGLGLAIVKSYVELLGGKFYIKTDGDLFKAVIIL